ncbi:MAG: hypothetical protein QOE90_3483, partial [Thermoplasmata archaeon]|nr:hypothetical protein [Thermoplasmata archaeon]
MTHLSRFVLAGLPAAGKTTYLAALWNALEARELPTELKLVSGPADKKYLNEVLSPWHGAAAVGHTSASTEEFIELVLEAPDGRHLKVEHADVSGESFRDMWGKRSWTPKLREYALHATGTLLFIHPDHVQMPTRVDEENKVLGRPLSDTNNVSAGPVQKGLAATFDPDKTPTATQLVFILQELQSASAQSHVPVAVIISAWDTLDGSSRPPEQWLEETLPLLNQYLETNAATHPYTVFGV